MTDVRVAGADDERGFSFVGARMIRDIVSTYGDAPASAGGRRIGRGISLDLRVAAAARTIAEDAHYRGVTVEAMLASLLDEWRLQHAAQARDLGAGWQLLGRLVALCFRARDNPDAFCRQEWAELRAANDEVTRRSAVLREEAKRAVGRMAERRTDFECRVARFEESQRVPAAPPGQSPNA